MTVGAETTKRAVRLRDLKAEQVAMDATRALADDVREKVGALDPALRLDTAFAAYERLVETSMYQAVLALARYALDGTPCDVQAMMARCAQLYGSAMRVGALPYDPEPTTPFLAVVLAARARLALTDRRALSSPEVALLIGVDRDYVNRMAGDDAIPGAYRDTEQPRSPWMFTGAAFRRWLADRGVTVG